jgi:zinc and cadmium transporter
VQFLGTLLTAWLIFPVGWAGLAVGFPQDGRCDLPSGPVKRIDVPKSSDSPQHSAIRSDETPGRGAGGPQEMGPSLRWSRTLLGAYCVLIASASLFGGWLPQRFQITHTRMQVIVSLIAGLMLAIGIFHMLPHALEELGEQGPDQAAYGMMGGLIGMFLIMRIVFPHQHGDPTYSIPARNADSSAPTGGRCPDHGSAVPVRAACENHGHSLAGAHRWGWLGVCLGMGLHSLIDGLALAASVESERLLGVTQLCGLGTFLAVFLHKPLDSVSITSLMAVSGWSPRSRNWANSMFSLICPLGAGLFVVGIHEFSGYQSSIVGYALAVSAGVFLCVALGDLLPEMEFHSHNRVRLTAALIAGIALGWGIHVFDSAHAHPHAHSESAVGSHAD